MITQTRAPGQLLHFVAALGMPGHQQERAGDPAFALANQWMDSFRANDQPLGESDRRLLVRILEDARVRSTDGLWAIIKQVNGDSADLRRLALELRSLLKRSRRRFEHTVAQRTAGAGLAGRGLVLQPGGADRRLTALRELVRSAVGVAPVSVSGWASSVKA